MALSRGISVYKTVSRFAPVAGLLVVLASCTQGTHRDLSENPRFTKNDPDTAILVIGVGLATNSRSIILGAWCPDMTLYWSSVNLDESRKSFSINKAGCQDKTPVEYSVVEIPAGQFVLDEIAIPQGYMAQPQRTRVRTLFGEQTFDQIRTPKFQIGKGEAVYVGDFILTYGNPVKLAKIQMSGTDARNALMRVLPDFNGPLINAQP